MVKAKRESGIIAQVAAFFVVSALLTGALTYFSQLALSDEYVTRETERLAQQIATETIAAVKEFPAYE